MIKANELRIGNFVTAIRCDNSQIIDQVKQLHESYVVTKFDWGKVEPIPLTEEWLTKLGFKQTEKIAQKIIRSVGRLGVLNVEKSKPFEIKLSYWVDDDGILISKIKYVHQLQNLYFALTGEELEIKF